MILKHFHIIHVLNKNIILLFSNTRGKNGENCFNYYYYYYCIKHDIGRGSRGYHEHLRRMLNVVRFVRCHLVAVLCAINISCQFKAHTSCLLLLCVRQPVRIGLSRIVQVNVSVQQCRHCGLHRQLSIRTWLIKYMFEVVF